jgi:hypothetical protein
MVVAVRILAVVEPTWRGFAALRHAIALGTRLGGGLDVLHDGPFAPRSWPVPGGPPPAGRAASEVALVETVDMVTAALLGECFGGGPVTVEVGRGGELARRLFAGEYGLVVLGRPDRTTRPATEAPAETGPP